MAPAANVIAAVASHPRILIQRFTVKRPMTSGRLAMRMTTAMIGTAMTPLITALQKSALMGSIEVKFIATPKSVESVKMA